MRLIVITLIISSVLFIENKILGQSDYKIQFYDLEDGLSQGSVYSFLQDHLGYMWMTSYEGLNRFDGNQFQVFLDSKNNPHSIRGNNVIGLVQDPYNNIWIGSEICLNKYIYSEDKFEHKYIDQDKTKSDHFPFYADSTEIWYMNENEGLVAYNYVNDTKEIINPAFKYNRDYFIIKAAIADQNKNIWIRTGRGITCVNRISKEIKTYYEDKNIRCHSIDANNNVWFEYRAEEELFSTIVKIDGHTGKFHEYNLEVDVGSEVLDLISLSDQEIWLATAFSGLLLVDLEEHKIIEQIDRSSSGLNSLPTSSVSNLYYDNDSVLWASNDPKGVFNVTIDDKPFGLINNFEIDNKEIKPGGYRSFYEVNEQEVLVGTEDEGIVVFDPTSGKIIDRLMPSLYNKRHASSLLIDKNNNLWIGSYQGLSILNLNTAKVEPYINPYLELPGSSKLIWNILQDKSGRIYYATDNGAYAFMNGTTYKIPIFQSSPTGILYIDEDDNLYIPAKGRGFAIIHIDSLWNDHRFNSEAVFAAHHIDCSIKSFHKNKDNLWLGTTQGLIQMVADKATNRYHLKKQYDTEDGFPSNVIYGILEDGDNLWLSSNRGLIKFLQSGKVVQVYNPSDGLQGFEYNTNTFCKLSSGMMLFGGVNGINFFFPEKITNQPREILPPHISHLSLQNDSTLKIYQENVIELDYRYNSFDIHFVSPYFKSSNLLNYEYSLNNEEWREASPPISFFELPPGKYQLGIRVKAISIEEKNPISYLTVTILPPWYKTTWFKLIVSLGALLIILSLINLRINAIKERERFQSRIRSLKMDALQSQMNPHFVFNCLNTVDSYIALNDRENASLFLNKFARLIREALRMTKKEEVSLYEELQFVFTYVELERERFNKPFEFNENIRNTAILKRIFLPPLLIQPIVENAIWHGVSKVECNGKLRLYDEINEDFYRLYISDNGPGFNEQKALNKKSSYGLNICQERITLHNRNSKCKIYMDIFSKDSTIIRFSFQTNNN